MRKQTVSARFGRLAGERREILETARQCAALTKPWLLPPEDHQPNQRLPENYQSTGSRGLTNLEGRMLLALFPPGVPWFQYKLAPRILYDPAVPDQMKRQIASMLLLRELGIMAQLEAVRQGGDRYRRRSGFRSRKRMAISMNLATGDVLEQLTDDYRLKTYTREQYVTKRDSAMDVMLHITQEKIDLQSLSPAHQELTRYPASKITADDPTKRIVDLHTLIEYQHDGKNWLIRQEINGNTIVESQETISPYFCTPFELVPGEDYGRGFIEQNLGDLRSHNEIRERKLDFAEAASRLLMVLGEGCTLREKDLEKKSGSIIRGGKVAAGQLQDAGFLKVDKLNDFQVVHLTDEAIRKDLGLAMLMETDATPRGERVTAYQVQRVAMELEGALGGVYSAINDDQQVPLLRRVEHQMERDNLLPVLPVDAVEVETVTGIAALSREMDAARLTQLIQGIVAIGQVKPEALAKVDTGVLVDALARYSAFYEPGLIKSDDQLAKEQRQAALQQLAMAGGEKAIDVAGNVAEANATQQQQTPSE